jgi:predicted DNA-binding WGR domain protein
MRPLTVMRERGRRGSPGTLRLDSYQRRDEAQSAEQRTIERHLHGYRVARSRVWFTAAIGFAKPTA